MIDLVVDTNVLVAAFRSSTGASYRLLQTIEQRRWRPWRPTLPDPDDDRILEVAVRTESPIVTFNVRDFLGSRSFGIRTMSPGELLTTMGDKR